MDASAAFAAERARWATSASSSAASLQDASALVAELAAENAALRAQLAADAAASERSVARAAGAEAAAVSALYAAEARAAAGEARAAAAAAAAADELAAARAEAAAELRTRDAALRVAALELEKLNDWAGERDAAAATAAELAAALAAAHERRRDDVALLERRNAADREGTRALMMGHLLEAKRALAAGAAANLDAASRRIVAEHDQLLDELAFTSGRAEVLLLATQKLEGVRLRARELRESRSARARLTAFSPPPPPSPPFPRPLRVSLFCRKSRPSSARSRSLPTSCAPCTSATAR
jgi:hypothetical protein